MLIRRNIHLLVNTALALTFLLSFHYLRSQDIHFSQFNNAPLHLNPALNSNFKGDYRFTFNHRNQWRSVTEPYNTFALAIEKKKVLLPYFNAGLSVVNDQAGDSEYGTFQIALNGSFDIYFGDSLHIISFGVQPSFTQRSINYNNLRFDNQFNGNFYDPSLDNGEQFERDGFTYVDLNTGINWNYYKNRRKQLNLGAGIFNWFSPNQSLFAGQSHTLKKRLAVHGNATILISNKLDAQPSMIYLRQHRFQEFILGGNAKYHLNQGNYKALYLGIWYRNKDASYLSAGVDYGNLHVEMSYDVNISTLSKASDYKGSYEFSLIYILHQYKPSIKRYQHCPTYL